MNEPVECKDGHINDPYPENGRCIVCGKWLPGNSSAYDAETAKTHAARKRNQKKMLDEQAKLLIKEAGFPVYKDAPMHLRMAAETATRTRNMKDLEFFTQQTKQLTAKPKGSEDIKTATIEVFVSDKLLESLRHLEDTRD
jgi:hypothetical protein